MRFLKLFFISVFAYLFATKSAYAYIDPGLGNQLMHIVLIAIAGALFGIKTLYATVKTFLKTLFRRHSKSD